MDKSFNFNLSERHSLSRLCIDRQLINFRQLCDFLKHLPYGRISNKSDLSLVLKENKGTCSTKHAFLAMIAKENAMSDISLKLGMYRMTNGNTPGIGSVLRDNELEYIPEAHVYLRIGRKLLDVTSKNPSSFNDYLMSEEDILPEQISGYKEEQHRTFIQKWKIEHSIPHTINDLWNIREQCIANLSQ